MLSHVSGLHSAAGYASVGVLAKGGMGEVALGMRETGTFRRLVAIKRLRPEYRDDDSMRAMFLAEARLAGLIRHPNVVGVLDVGDDEGGPYLVMDYIEGIDAHRLLRWSSKRGEAIPVQVVLQILHQTALGLAAAHELKSTQGELLNLVHRDVSPQNILLGYDGLVRLTDFGIAKARGSDKTSTGLLKGKLGYMAPEQLQFEHPTQKSDLFSFGVVLYEMLAGRRLYKGEDNVAVAKMIVRAPVPDLSEVREGLPAPLIELCTTLLQKDPEAREVSAREVAARLAAIADELAADEGRVRLDEYLREHFGEERAGSRARTEDMLREYESSRSIRMDAAAAPVTTPPSARPRIATWLAFGALVVGAAALGAFLASGDSDPPSTETPAAASQPQPAAPEVEAVAEPVPVEAAEPVVEAAEVTEAEEVTEEEPVATEPETTAAPERSRRRRRGRRPSMSGMFDALDLIERAN